MMTSFQSRRPPRALEVALRERLRRAHRDQPFSPLDPRDAVTRAAEAVGELGLEAVTWRGGVGLSGVEVDHVWLVVDGWVLDAAFPLFAEEFRRLLAGWVAGDVDNEALLEAALPIDVDARVLGTLPPATTYLGAPVWSARGLG